jgi:hypothetical protein
MRNTLLIMSMLLLGACSTVTIQPEKIAKLEGEPSYQDSRHFFFWGLMGQHRVDVKQVCGDKKVLQMQSQQTLGDGVLGAITFGIYAPHSVKVWCEENTPQVQIPMEVGSEG